MSPVLREQLLLLPEYLQGHLALTFAALGAGIAMSVPLGIVASRSPRIRHPLLATVSLIQTVPGLAILALVVAMLGGQIGFLPAFIALTLYSMLPIMRNTVSGLEGVPAEVVEAARGIGLAPRQRLWKVRTAARAAGYRCGHSHRRGVDRWNGDIVYVGRCEQFW